MKAVIARLVLEGETPIILSILTLLKQFGNSFLYMYSGYSVRADMGESPTLISNMIYFV